MHTTCNFPNLFFLEPTLWHYSFRMISETLGFSSQEICYHTSCYHIENKTETIVLYISQNNSVKQLPNGSVLASIYNLFGRLYKCIMLHSLQLLDLILWSFPTTADPLPQAECVLNFSLFQQRSTQHRKDGAGGLQPKAAWLTKYFSMCQARVIQQRRGNKVSVFHPPGNALHYLLNNRQSSPHACARTRNEKICFIVEIRNKSGEGSVWERTVSWRMGWYAVNNCLLLCVNARHPI